MTYLSMSHPYLTKLQEYQEYLKENSSPLYKQEKNIFFLEIYMKTLESVANCLEQTAKFKVPTDGNFRFDESCYATHIVMQENASLLEKTMSELKCRRSRFHERELADLCVFSTVIPTLGKARFMFECQS